MEATMLCPNCGAEASARQKFCRACGLSLDRFARLLAEAPANIEDKNVTRAKLRRTTARLDEKIEPRRREERRFKEANMNLEGEKHRFKEAFYALSELRI